MAVKNQITNTKKAKLSAYLTNDAVKKQINGMIGGENGQRFIASIISATSTNPTLQECDNGSILSAALLGESLKLSPSPQLGYYYMVPFNDKRKGKVAQFQLGYKGYIQLAIRSGQYKTINVVAVKEGELESFNPLTEEIDINIDLDNWDDREAKETIGYYACFKLVNGFEKAMYWSKKQMEAHALKYSMGYKAKKGYTFWEKDFDQMAFKTMLRQLISKWGIMSIEMQTAMDSDMAVINDDGSKDYVEVDSYNAPVEEVEAEIVTEETASTPKETKTAPKETKEDEQNAAQQALFG